MKAGRVRGESDAVRKVQQMIWPSGCPSKSVIESFKVCRKLSDCPFYGDSSKLSLGPHKKKKKNRHNRVVSDGKQHELSQNVYGEQNNIQVWIMA